MTDKGPHILIVDDEPQIRKLLKVSLEAHGYQLYEATTGQDGINLAAMHRPELAIVDLGLPDMDGRDVVLRIREWSQMPIIVLTVRDQEQGKIETLDAGADDYLTKPFSVGELMARMRVALRRAVTQESEPIVTIGDLVIDLTRRSVTVRKQEVRLTPTEYEILKILARYPGRVITHNQLLKSVWGNAASDDTHYIRIYIGQLRRKIEQDPAQPQYIITESGVGYRLNCLS
ncbi:MAG: response regulator [Negativicutes bacterium]|nr:response regulator [Negativicutes bacterium]